MRWLLLSTVVLAALCALGGTLYAYFHGGTTYQHAIAWAMWLAGGGIVLLTGMSGSTTRTAGQSRVVVGGRFTEGSNIPMPTSPLFLVGAGFLVVALGVLVYIA